MTTLDTLTGTLAWPTTADEQPPGWRQSLAKGAAGFALLHIERAGAGTGSWETAHAWLAAATRGDITVGPHTGLFFGAPAVAYALHTANIGRPGRYERPLATLDRGITGTTRRRLDHALTRIDRAELSRLGEWDLINGLTGIGAYLLRRDPHGALLREVLSYLTRLTEPLRLGDELLPGWWTTTAPTGDTSPRFPGGHGNLGTAHGIAGPLALLSLALRRGVVVDGHEEALARICSWLDNWRQDTDTGPWWPQWVTRNEQRTGRLHRRGPVRPSWCYGTPGLARAQQLAGIATGDAARHQIAETALSGCLTDPTQLDQLTDPSICHGWAGLYQTARRISQDAPTPELSNKLRRVHKRLTEQAIRCGSPPTGLLEGAAGAALALHANTKNHAAPATDWDACLLIC